MMDPSRPDLRQQLAAAQARFDEVQTVAKIGSWETALPGGEVTWSAETYRIFEVDQEGFGGTHRSFLTFVHPGDRAAVEATFAASHGEDGAHRIEHRIITPAGKVKMVEERWQTFRDDSGQPVRATGTCQDITDRKRLEELQFNSRQMLLAVLDAIPHRVFWKNPDGVYLGCNRQFAIDMGFAEPQDVIGKTDFDASWRDAAEQYRADDRAVIESRQPRLNYEERLPRPDGQSWWLRTSKVVLQGTDGSITGILGVYEDITEQRKLEQQFLRAQRLESIGTLAGGIAHDLNNALAPILMSLALLIEDERDPSKLSVLNTIEQSAKRGAMMVRQVLSFARGVDSRRDLLRLADIVNEVCKICDETFMKNIAVVAKVAAEPWAVRGDPTQLHQVLMNLAVNARDAMPEGGTLTLSLQNQVVDDQYAAMVDGGHAGPHVVIEVQDTGTGMAADVLDRIFDPFFTTKDVGHGTGLGLSTSQTIVRSHGGFIRVYSEPGRGTTFRIYLPAVTSAVTPASQVRRSAEMRRGRGELVLVIDDEAAVREITCLTLEHHGYRTLVAQDGAEAVAAYASHSGEVAAVLVDRMMPVMNGVSTIQVLQRINPRVRVIACSGRVEAERIPADVSAAIVHFLPKPFTAQSLLGALDQLLQGRDQV
jgi:PAS domain S-box-containing protein